MKLHYYFLFLPYFFIKVWELSLALIGREKDSLRILLCHNIEPNDFEWFEKNLLKLQYKWRFITPNEFEKHMSGEARLSGKCLLLTFDDGFKSNRFVAEHILEKLGIRAIFFVVTKYIDTKDINQSRSFYARNIMPGANLDQVKKVENMNWDDLRWLVSHGHLIGSHTMTHRRLSEISKDSDLFNEINYSGNRIEEELGNSIRHFAFPFGDINSLSKNALQYVFNRYDYVYSGLRGDNAKNINNISIRRDALNPYKSNLILDVFLSGAADMFYRRSRLKLDKWAKILIRKI